jgi:hypothetical protein
VTEPGNEVEERLQGLSEALRGDPGSEWARRIGWALLAALRVAVGQHRLIEGAAPWTAGGPLPRCHCGLWWPCDTVTDVLAELEEL